MFSVVYLLTRISELSQYCQARGGALTLAKTTNRLAIMGRVGIAVALVLLCPAGLWAQEGNKLPIDVEVPQALVVGKGRPFVKLRAVADVRNVRVTVSRRGWKRTYRAASLAAGAERTFTWNERPGVYGYSATVHATRGSNKASQNFTWELSYLDPIEMRLKRRRIDLSTRRLDFTLNHPADRAAVVVKGPGGRVLTRAERSYDGAAPGTNLTIEWPAVDDEITRIEVIAYGMSGYWTGVAVVPWSMSIPHEEVEFATNRSEITTSEEPKLDRALALVHKAMREHPGELTVNLYVGGFTDTVGSKAHNRDLSLERARAIARYFAKHDVTIPIYYRGFGEEVPAVSTADETSEPRNRRAAYILSPQAPTLVKARAIGWGNWQRLAR